MKFSYNLHHFHHHYHLVHPYAITATTNPTTIITTIISLTVLPLAGRHIQSHFKLFCGHRNYLATILLTLPKRLFLYLGGLHN